MTTKQKHILSLYSKMNPNTWSYADLEDSMVQLAGCKGYQDVKPIILEADQVGIWLGVISNYLQTNKDAHGNLSMEFDHLASKYGIH